MTEEFKIFIEQLRDGHQEEIKTTLPPDFLNADEEELSFDAPVSIQGEVYRTDGDLILNFSCETTAKMPCAICNKEALVTIKSDKICHPIDIQDLKSLIYDFSELVRTELLLKIPQFAECSSGKCPERVLLKKYEKKIVTQFPFQNL